MVVHYTLQTACSVQFLIAKIDKEVFLSSDDCSRLRQYLNSKFNVPVYLLCEEVEPNVIGEVEWIREYIIIFESGLPFEMLEVEPAHI